MSDSATADGGGMLPAQTPWTEGAAVSARSLRGSGRSLVVFGVIAAFQVVLVTTHVHWRDELQALLIAQDSRSLADLFANLRYEGHPALWYLVLRAASLLERSPAALTVVQAVVALATLSLLWRFAPFPLWMKAAAGASYFLMYEYGTIARSYGLGVVLVFAFMAVRHRPVAWLMLALIANVALHFAALSVVLVALMVVERRWSIAGAALWVAGMVAAAMTMMPASDAQPALRLFPDQLANLLLAVHSLSATIVPVDLTRAVFIWNLPTSHLGGLAIGLATLAIGWLALRADQRLAALYGLAYMGFVLIFTTIYFGQARHAGLLFVLVLVLHWARCEAPGNASPTRSNPALTTWLAIGAGCGLWAAGWALVSPVSSAREVADWIAARGLGGTVWAAEPGLYGVEISGRFGVPTYNLDKECLNTFVRWTVSEAAIPLPELSARLRTAASANGGRLHVLSYRDLSATPDLEVKLLTLIPRDRMLEHKYLYQVTVPLAGPATSLPRCP
jgi:hypothetical protein